MDAELMQVAHGPALLTSVQFNRRFHQLGSPPSQLQTFAIIRENVTDVRWCGQEVTDSDVLCFTAQGYEAVSEQNFGCHTLSFGHDHLAHVAGAIGLSHIVDRPSETAIALHGADEAVKAVRHRLDHVWEHVTQWPATLDSPGIKHEIEFEIPARLLRAIESSQPKKHRVLPSRLRAAGLRKALLHLDENATESTTVKDVCSAAGVSWRTLNYAFRERFGVTPKQYLKATKLNRVRRELYRVGRAAKVAEVANRWGFWHMGQFAADYRRQFGELPSDSLKRWHRTEPAPG